MHPSEQLHPIQQANFLELQFTKCLINYVSDLPLSAFRAQCFLSPFQKEFDAKLIQLKIWNPVENSTTVYQCLQLLYILFIKISDDGSLMGIKGYIFPSFSLICWISPPEITYIDPL